MFNLILKTMTTTTKLENKLQAIYTENGYAIECDNRSYFTKSINKALQNPAVKFELCKNGYHWVSKDTGSKFNLRILIDGTGKRFMAKDFTPEGIADCFAMVAKMEHVKNIKIHQDAYTCDKCHGKGFIPAFSHVCKGVCFDCLGIGYKFHSGKW